MTLPASVVADLRLHVMQFGNMPYVFTTATGKALEPRGLAAIGFGDPR
jgi:hypothetical protein